MAPEAIASICGTLVRSACLLLSKEAVVPA
jgi:hypothetical protein